MAITDLPAFFDMVFVKEDKRLSPDGYLYNDQTFQILNELVTLVNAITSTTVNSKNVPLVSVNGLNPPSKTTTEIATLFADASIPVGTIWYDSNLGKLKFKGATLQEIASTP